MLLHAKTNTDVSNIETVHVIFDTDTNRARFTFWDEGGRAIDTPEVDVTQITENSRQDSGG